MDPYYEVLATYATNNVGGVPMAIGGPGVMMLPSSTTAIPPAGFVGASFGAPYYLETRSIRSDSDSDDDDSYKRYKSYEGDRRSVTAVAPIRLATPIVMASTTSSTDADRISALEAELARVRSELITKPTGELSTYQKRGIDVPWFHGPSVSEPFVRDTSSRKSVVAAPVAVRSPVTDDFITHIPRADSVPIALTDAHFLPVIVSPMEKLKIVLGRTGTVMMGGKMKPLYSLFSSKVKKDEDLLITAKNLVANKTAHAISSLHEDGLRNSAFISWNKTDSTGKQIVTPSGKPCSQGCYYLVLSDKSGASERSKLSDNLVRVFNSNKATLRIIDADFSVENIQLVDVVSMTRIMESGMTYGIVKIPSTHSWSGETDTIIVDDATSIAISYLLKERPSEYRSPFPTTATVELAKFRLTFWGHVSACVDSFTKA